MARCYEALRRAARVKEPGEYALAVPVVVLAVAPATTTTTWLFLPLESCLPTVTSVATFGSFRDTRLFERTPVAAGVGRLFATMVRVAWFADGEMVCQDAWQEERGDRQRSVRQRAGLCCYTPTRADVGKTLTTVITPLRPGRAGRAEAYQFQRKVEALPDLPLMESRAEFLAPRSRDDGAPLLRVATYNILADQNASRDADRGDDDQIYAHCDASHLVKWRRHPLIVHELLAYAPDVVALQEVDADVYADLLRPTLGAEGYEGYYARKGAEEGGNGGSGGGGGGGGIREGCALFWRRDVFEGVRPADRKTHNYRDMMRQFACPARRHRAQWPSLDDSAKLLAAHRPLRRVVLDKLGHVLQTVALTRRDTGERLVVGNSHLFYHPRASHVRCLQALAAARQLEIEQIEHGHCPVLFCGDFNSHPTSGVLRLLLGRRVAAGNGKTWSNLRTYAWEAGRDDDDAAAAAGADGDGGDGDGDVDPAAGAPAAIDLALPPSCPDLASAYPDPPAFTHFIEAFVCTLDYILVS